VTSRHDDVTVVVTNYNYGRYLEEAVASALDQRAGSPHVIVVDDGSTDPDTDEVLGRLPASVTIQRQPNAGLAAARNAGLRQATTPYLIVLDADDHLAPGALDALRAPLDADAELGFAYGITRFFGQWEGEMSMPPYDPYRLLYRHTIGSTCLMRRELFEQVGGFDPGFRGYEDWEFWLHALAHGWHGHRVEQVTFEYRRHGATMLSGARRDYRSWYRRLRAKHAPLYARRRELAQESALGPVGRAVYRWWWGARPMPARLEHVLHTVLWRVVKWRARARRRAPDAGG
jgi:glycosyltransferase involved in cell wall biosynthesis